jgi:hypothetical protein
MKGKIVETKDGRNTIDVDVFVNLLRDVLKGNDKFKVEFDNEDDHYDFILDVCNEFRNQLLNR